MTRLLRRSLRVIELLALILVLAAPARAEAEGEKPKDKESDEAVTLASARSDAYLNLSAIVTNFPVGQATIRDLIAADPRIRNEVEAAVRSAVVVEGPFADPNGLVHVVVQMDTFTLPYNLRLRIPNLPRSFRVDGLADKTAALNVANMVPTQGKNVTDQMKAWAESMIEAEGTATVERSSNAELSKEIARHLATANAYTALARKAGDLLLDEGVPLSAWLEQHEGVREEFNAALVQAKLVSESLNREGTLFKVNIALRGAALMRPLRLGSFRNPTTPLSAEQISLARENARLDAIDLLKKRIYALPLRSGITAGDLVKTRKAMEPAIDNLCRMAPVDKVQITNDGIFKMSVSVPTDTLPAEMKELLQTGTPGRVYALGGGLPLPRKQPEADKPAAKPPTDKPADKPVADKPTDKPAADKPADQPADKPVAEPADKTAPATDE